MKVLLTGGSGFIAAHCVDILLKHDHDVVFTVRSDEKGQKILKNHPGTPSSKLSYVIVKDIAQENAFDEAVKSDLPFEAVLHTASPFHFNVTDVKKDLLDPAIIGTTGILKAVKKSAPSVKRVVVTSSFASIINPAKHPEKYSEEHWNPITQEEAVQNPSNGYRASKTFAEKAAWDFVEKEKPNFQLSTINPPLVLGPVVHYLNSLDGINTSNERIANMIQGKCKEKGLPPTGTFLWVDVRDVALAHVKAAEVPDAAGKRFFVTAGYMSNGEIAQIIKKNFPDLVDKLPTNLDSDRPKDLFGYDNSRSKEVLGIKYNNLEETIKDTVKSLLAVVEIQQHGYQKSCHIDKD
ncbi:Glycine-rich RNA-binding protein 2, mitochondrial [Exophiala sideris]|uniref:Glycine-rich RNA-binding protein 2, mitochondrial n=1 Tax=Exophiala sideris TaxID=1016849 RepID=A0ABR0J6D8_9EURO|nr:Glycine-rich RNA-binding protein 2, mitochondrial [Exophiala sideris]KAK5035565.1 Glycine-rich RNA-binding protein 2, mitochondrial [Exophiala sideris]KAK5057201.1 Glycine-rich RNA-binding protein 2, mitochondrial [Exophiala sideris]